ncbi:MAG: AMP-binding protein [Deltaproteobacteria bacterium]|nr:AMP-binding protein [Deltaproteobacteria bacterium]MBW2383305.1 AMP-binding protein [Deltaproteobacteria bacterium]
MSGSDLHRPITHSELVVNSLKRWPDRQAFRQDGRSWTYAESADLLARFARVLQERGLEPGQGVGVLSPNRPEVWLSQNGACIAGGRYTALHPMGSLSDHEYACNEAELRLLCVDPAYASRAGELLAACPSVEGVLSFGPAEVGDDLLALAAGVGPVLLEPGPLAPDDTSWLLYTGGTTGVPKAAELPEAAVAQMALAVSSGWDLPKQRRYLACAPITHAAGMLITPTLMSGGCVILQRSFDPARWLADIVAERATLTLLVPTMIYALLDQPGLDGTDFSLLESIMYGASPMSPARLVEGIERIGPVFAQLYGQTECGGVATSLWREHHDVKNLERLASCGLAMPNARVEILGEDGRRLPDGEAGEICVQGPCVMKGYFKQPELTAETLVDGWLHTGDIAVRDDEGFFTIVDRKKDMIVSGGFNVFPREIEDVLSTHPTVSTVAVIGVPDEKWGEAVKAIVVPRPGASIDAEVLIELVKKRKGSIYAPKTVDVVEALPLTAVGKADKKVLRAQYWGDAKRGVH